MIVRPDPATSGNLPVHFFYMDSRIHIRSGSISEVVSLIGTLPEFDRPHPASTYETRLSKRPHLVLIAAEGDRPVACKVGYEREQDGSFYSWMGGVHPDFRRKGLARQLAEAQEAWAREQGYQLIRFKTRNRHRKMLLFAIGRGFRICGYEPFSDPMESRIWLEKEL